MVNDGQNTSTSLNLEQIRNDIDSVDQQIQNYSIAVPHWRKP